MKKMKVPKIETGIAIAGSKWSADSEETGKLLMRQSPALLAKWLQHHSLKPSQLLPIQRVVINLRQKETTF